METIIKRNKSIKPKNPILVVGLPGIGNVGKLVAEHLKREFKAVRFATLYSPHFPHQVVMLKNGCIRLVSNRFYLIKSKKANGNDIVLLTGDVQAVSPEGQYAVNSKIVDFFKNELKGTFIYTIGGYSIGEANAIVKSPRVFGNVTSKEVMKQFSGTNVVFKESRGLIWGSAGLINGVRQDEQDGWHMPDGRDQLPGHGRQRGKGGDTDPFEEAAARRQHRKPRQDNNQDRKGDKGDREAAGNSPDRAAAASLDGKPGERPSYIR